MNPLTTLKWLLASWVGKEQGGEWGDLAGICREVSAEGFALEVAAVKLKPIMWVSGKQESQPGSLDPCRAAVAPESKT